MTARFYPSNVLRAHYVVPQRGNTMLWKVSAAALAIVFASALSTAANTALAQGFSQGNNTHANNQGQANGASSYGQSRAFNAGANRH